MARAMDLQAVDIVAWQVWLQGCEEEDSKGAKNDDQENPEAEATAYAIEVTTDSSMIMGMVPRKVKSVGRRGSQDYVAVVEHNVVFGGVMGWIPGPLMTLHWWVDRIPSMLQERMEEEERRIFFSLASNNLGTGG